MAGHYSCGQARASLERVVAKLSGLKVLLDRPDPHALKAMTTMCSPCTSAPHPGRCLGWRTMVDPTAPFILGPFPDKKTSVTLAVSADTNFRRLAVGSRSAWQQKPIAG